MNNSLRKQWTSILGAVFIFVAFIYLLKYAVNKDLLSDNLKIAVGIGIGTGIISLGIFFNQKNSILSQILIGLGISFLYITFSFAGIYYNIWTSLTVFISTVLVTITSIVYSYKTNSRLLINLSVLGSLIAPLIMKPHGDQVFTLFLYLIVINASFFYISISKKWFELLVTPFLGTWILYTVYYLYFHPKSFELPLFYATAAFIFYVSGFVVSSWKNTKDLDILNVYLGVLNGIAYLVWGILITSHNQINNSLIFFIAGITYLIASSALYFISKQFSLSVLSKFFVSMSLLLIAGNELSKTSDFHSIILTLTWSIVTMIVLLIGNYKKITALKIIPVFTWIAVLTYWFVTTWTAPLGKFFGVFIPIFNLSGLTWIFLAFIGFYISQKVEFECKDYYVKELHSLLSVTVSILSHLIVGGLLTFQIDNIWEEYHIKSFDLWLTLSVTWGIYALFLYILGAHTKDIVFKIFGAIVLIIVAIKTIFIDLSNADMIFKIITLLILAVISFLITYINNKSTHIENKNSSTD